MMKTPRRRFLQILAGAATLTTGHARAQTYPSRPITLVVPYPPGGPSDSAARIIADGLRAALGQPIVIENIAGGSGSVGVGRVARAAGDGYTLVVGIWNTHVANPALLALSYDVEKDFEPIGLISSYPVIIVVRKSLPVNDLQGLVAWLRENPDKASQGTAGAGSGSHIQGISFQRQTGTRYQFVPYRGQAPAMQDLVAGHIDILFDGPATSLPQIRAGSIRALAVMSKDRLPSAPDIPTVDEAGFPGFYFSNWNAIFAPKGTPHDVIRKLNDACVNALADRALRQRIVDIGQSIPLPDQQTPQALGALQKAEIEKWWPIIKAANIKGE
jgi:tripartite-type tricarboxylate transporter receptor subunit TctC